MSKPINNKKYQYLVIDQTTLRVHLFSTEKEMLKFFRKDVGYSEDRVLSAMKHQVSLDSTWQINRLATPVYEEQVIVKKKIDVTIRDIPYIYNPQTNTYERDPDSIKIQPFLYDQV